MTQWPCEALVLAEVLSVAKGGVCWEGLLLSASEHVFLTIHLCQYLNAAGRHNGPVGH